jgi:hypothetical protein
MPRTRNADAGSTDGTPSQTVLVRTPARGVSQRPMDKGERSPAARERAGLALVHLLWELRDEDPFLVVLGGLVPQTLADERGT